MYRGLHQGAYNEGLTCFSAITICATVWFAARNSGYSESPLTNASCLSWCCHAQIMSVNLHTACVHLKSGCSKRTICCIRTCVRHLHLSAYQSEHMFWSSSLTMSSFEFFKRVACQIWHEIIAFVTQQGSHLEFKCLFA